MKTYAQNLSSSNTLRSYSSLADSGVKNDAGIGCPDRRRKAISTMTARAKNSNAKPKTVVYDFVGIAG